MGKSQSKKLKYDPRVHSHPYKEDPKTTTMMTTTTTTTKKKKKKKKKSRIELSVLLLVVICSFGILIIQMWILEVHISSSSFESSSSLLVDSVTAKFAKTNDVENNFGGTHNDNNNDEDDEDLSPILKILRQGGYDTSISNKAIDRSLLPKWSNILKAYGPPKIYGLQTCQQFQDTVKKSERNIAPAGLFNTGTNLMQHLLKDNCEWETPRRYGGNRWQVPVSAYFYFF